jgi:predicted HAD superfamily Cof-like phosphohydrolase
MKMKSVSQDIINSILLWQQLARPIPDDKGRIVAIGCNIEEQAEFFDSLGAPELAHALDSLATAFKTGMHSDAPLAFSDLKIDRQAMLDALCDIIVTSVGVGHMLGMDIETALGRVNDSNWSKFVDGKPIFDANGKIQKGPQYRVPNLEGLF